MQGAKRFWNGVCWSIELRIYWILGADPKKKATAIENSSSQCQAKKCHLLSVTRIASEYLVSVGNCPSSRSMCEFPNVTPVYQWWYYLLPFLVLDLRNVITEIHAMPFFIHRQKTHVRKPQMPNSKMACLQNTSSYLAITPYHALSPFTSNKLFW